MPNETPTTRLTKIGLSKEVAEKLAARDIRSVSQLANLTAPEWREKFEGIDLGKDTISSIRKRAEVMRALVTRHLLTVHGQVSPAYRALASTNTANKIIDFHEGMESYPELFGDPDYFNASEFDSMISPAAYLVDLMRYIDEYIKQPTNKDDLPLTLESRRPDLRNIPLTMENTVDEVPYLSLVNEILRAKLDGEEKIKEDGSFDPTDKIVNALRYMAVTIFPFCLPFNAPLEQIRKYLGALETSLYAVYKTFRIDPAAQIREYLGLSPEQAAYLTAKKAMPGSLNLAYGNIKTTNPRPHFTGIHDDANLGSLNNAEIFMNQVGFPDTAQLRALFYQQINTELPGSDTLLNNLFINKKSSGYHLAYSALDADEPDWADEEVWKDESYYSTIQRVVVDHELYLLVRKFDGIETWKYNASHRRWMRLATASPALSDKLGWYRKEYYSTIQTVVVKGDDPLKNPDKLFLFGRFTDGIHTWKFDASKKTWTELKFIVFPDWTDAKGWTAPDRYKTIKTAALGDTIFMIGRQPDGLDAWCLDTSRGEWARILPLSPPNARPDFSDGKGWKHPDQYMTIQITAYPSLLVAVVIGRSSEGIETYFLFKNGLNYAWLNMSSDPYPRWDNVSGWDQPVAYSTIQLCRVGGSMFLIGYDGKQLWVYDGPFKWVLVNIPLPNWHNPDWHSTDNYETLQTFAISETQLGLLGRGPNGIQTWELDLGTKNWSSLTTDSPKWTDNDHWAEPSYNKSIRTIVVDSTIFLTGCTKTAIEMYRFDRSTSTWNKEIPVKAVIELENGSSSKELTMAVLDQLNGFIRLAGILGWEYEDLDWALISAEMGEITTDAFTALKNLKWIMDDLQLTVWQATSFWHDLKTYGEGHGPESTAPFDIVFNRPMPFVKKAGSSDDPYDKLYHPNYKPNPNFKDTAVNWRTDGKGASGHSIVLRLMGSLQLDARNLKALIDHLRAAQIIANTNELELTVENLSVLYRYALLANSLVLTVPELILLLGFLGLGGQKKTFNSDEVIRVIDCHRWMMDSQLNVYQLNYICASVSSIFIDTGFDLLKMPSLLKSLADSAAEWCLNAKQLQTGELMTEPMSHVLYDTFLFKRYMDDRGILLTNSFSFSDVSNCFLCEEIGFGDRQRLVPVCRIGQEAKSELSQIMILFPPKKDDKQKVPWNGSISIWFSYDSKQKGVCTVFSLDGNGIGLPVNFSVKIDDGNLVFDRQGQRKNLYALPATPQWHFLVISFKKQTIRLDKEKAIPVGLNIPDNYEYQITIGAIGDSFGTGVAEMRACDPDDDNDPKGDNIINYWPFNEGQGSTTARDLIGDRNGKYNVNVSWSIVFATVIPPDHSFLKDGHLSDGFDPTSSDPVRRPFVELWKTVTGLCNVLNSTIAVQKQGVLQKLADFYRVNKGPAVYADYIAKQDDFQQYIQTLLAYRFSLSWEEYALGLDRDSPYIGSYLNEQFAGNKINLSGKAEIKRLPDKDGHPADKWLIMDSADVVYYLGKRDEALDVYRLLPSAPGRYFRIDDGVPDGERYKKFHFDGQFKLNRSVFYGSDSDEQFAVFQLNGEYGRFAIYDLPDTQEDVVSRIKSFLSDVGQLLFAVRALKLTEDEFACVIDNRERFFPALAELRRGVFSLSELKALSLFKRLNTAYTAQGMSFVGYFNLPDDRASLVNYLAKLTQWDAEGLRQLSEWNCPYEKFGGDPSANKPSNLAVGAGDNYAIAGYPLANEVRVYELKGEKWEHLPRIVPPDNSGFFGAAVAVERHSGGNGAKLWAVIADTKGNAGCGIVYVYTYNEHSRKWDSIISLKANDGVAGDAFGSAVSIYQDTMVIGATGAAKTGKVYVFKWRDDQWTEEAIVFQVQPNDQFFGASIQLCGNVLAVGSAQNAYLYGMDVPMGRRILVQGCNSAKVATNGEWAVFSGTDNGRPVVYSVHGLDTPKPSGADPLVNDRVKGNCTVAMEGDTLILNDSANTCFVYYIQDTNLSFKQSVGTGLPASGPASPITLGNGNLVTAGANGDGSIILFYGNKHTIDWCGFAEECFGLAGKLGCSIGTLLGFVNLSGLQMKVRCASGAHLPDQDDDTTYAAYQDYADKLIGALSMSHPGGAWDTLYEPMRKKFLEQERNALAGYLIYSLRAAYTDITGIDDLYELLLIDVGSGGCRSISRIKSALNSLQLYIGRCRMRLEPHVSLVTDQGDGSDAADVEWDWMSHYRVWEANRQVFLFPETYYDPALRKDRTDAYSDLQNKLSQSNLTSDNATEAFQAYFNDLETLTGLTIVSSCLGHVTSFVNGRIILKNTWFIFARTKNRDEGYFYRTADTILPTDAPDTWVNWTNWEKIGISIKADSVTAVYASSRLYLFWLELTKKQVSGNDQQYNERKSFDYETTVYYSFQHSNGRWANPHEMPDPGRCLNFDVQYNGADGQVNVPPAEIVFLNPFLNVANLKITPTVSRGVIHGKGTCPSNIPFSIPIDGILDLHERYMWSFNVDTSDLRGGYSLGTPQGATIVTGNAIFLKRKILSLDASYIAGLTMDPYFNTWFNESFTLGLWLMVNVAGGAAWNWNILLHKSPDEAPDQFYFVIEDGYPAFGASKSPLMSKTRLQPATWYFLVFRYDAKTRDQSIFINGVRDNYRTNPDALTGQHQNFLGYQPPGTTANVADLFTTHATLADSEILSIYTQYINVELSADVENYEWELNTGFKEVHGDPQDALTPSTPTITFQPATGGGPFAAGREVLGLNGANKESVALPDPINNFFKNSFSIGIWVYGDFPPAGDWPILGSSKATPGEAFCLSIRNGFVYLKFSNSETKGVHPVATKAWHFLVFTFDKESRTRCIFVDGVLEITDPNQFPYLGSSTFHLGCYDNGYASGQMANLLLVNKVLSAAEVSALYSGTLSPNLFPPPPDYVAALNVLQEANARRIQQFNEDLFAGGADYLFGKNSLHISRTDLSAAAPYGRYLWELFYHIPMLVAQLLSGNQKFADAKKWYEYIFDPMAADDSADRFWQLGYFRSLGKPEDLVEILTDSAQKTKEEILLYDLDPFDPEAIAYLRPGAFEKKTVVNYIRNLLAWGDNLFSEYTWETMTQAEMLYVLAKELLGKKRDISGTFKKRVPMTIQQIEDIYKNDIPQFVIDIEDKQPKVHPGVQATMSMSPSHFYFGIPENNELTSYHDLVDTRLYEIRNCLNILGQEQTMALFEPAINPMALVAAAAAGGKPGDVPIGYPADIPSFRFNKMIVSAKSLAERVMSFGGQILAALEKKDGESLALLQSTQERVMLELTTAIKEKGIEEAINQGLVLEQSLASANERIGFYNKMLAKPISDLEAQALAYNATAIAIEVPATELHVAAVIGHLIPTVYGFADGDFSPGGSIESAASALSTGSNLANNTANMTSVSASYKRREEDWGLQLKLAQYEAASINQQKKSNAIQLQNARTELGLHQQSLVNNRNLEEYYKNKFTNKELYLWMIDQLSGVHYQAFQLALDLAKKAQAAYQFEMNTNDSIISYGYWDSTRRGLLSGERLAADLDRMEKAYMDNSQRLLEIQKIVSLKKLAPDELEELKLKGTCKISLGEDAYDRDFPGHYDRKIKSVSITIPAIVGPYQSIKATLVQSSNMVVTRPDLNTVKWLTSKDRQQAPDGRSLRVNWRPNQQIAISKASGDSGLFELNFNDERYLPFEGTGAISEWVLRIPTATNSFGFKTISDVILYINYTARDGGVAFAEQVMGLRSSSSQV